MLAAIVGSTAVTASSPFLKPKYASPQHVCEEDLVIFILYSYHIHFITPVIASFEGPTYTKEKCLNEY